MPAAAEAVQSSSALITILGGLLGGGVLSGLVALWRFRKTGSAERDSIIAEASSRVVEAMNASLDRTLREQEETRKQLAKAQAKAVTDTAKIKRLEEEVALLHETVVELESRIETVEKNGNGSSGAHSTPAPHR